MKNFRFLVVFLVCAGLSLVCAAPAVAQAQARPGSLRGTITDPSGAVIPGIQVTATGPGGVARTASTDEHGVYEFTNLLPGRYVIKVSAQGFAPYEGAAQVAPNRRAALDIAMAIAAERQQVEVSEDVAIGVEAENNAGAVVIKGQDLEALPDDPEELAEALQALAGPSAGPNGGQFFIDGFSGGRLPPRESIREIRINQNPFASEFDRMGMGRIEIFTRPGSDRVRGGFSVSFNDESLNSRNPFAVNRAPYQMRRFEGNIGGPIVKNKASYRISFQRREIDDNDIIHATVLDDFLNASPFNLAVLTPRRSTEFDPRFDYKLNDKHTLMVSYNYERSGQENSGVGEFSLPTRAFDVRSHSHSLRFTETAILSTKVVNETRVQFRRDKSEQFGDNSIPTLQVLSAFTGGGSQVGRASSLGEEWEIQNFTSRASGRHAVKFGGRVRRGLDKNASPNNFGGSWTFSGGPGPELDANNQPVLGSDGQPVVTQLTSLERYRRTLLFQQLGRTPAQIRALGGLPTQFSISAGNPLTDVSQVDVGLFLQDDWRVRPNLTVSAGIRYEAQSNISNNLDFAPRLSFAWSPDGARQPKTVIRGGFGIFYDRFSQNLVLQARRFDGLRQQQYIVNDPAILGLFPNVPSVESLAEFNSPQTIRRVASDLRTPYTTTGAISIERQLPRNMTVSVTYIRNRTLHMLRTVNVNAPLPGTVTPGNRNGVRPLPYPGNIYEYQSNGVLNQHQVIFNSFNRLSRRLTLFGNFSLGKSQSDTDGVFGFPADPNDYRADYGRSSLDIRRRVFLGGSITLMRGITLNPFIIARSGSPFNITTGLDNNGDLQFSDRPALATDLNRPSVVQTNFGAFDINPLPGAAIIPRNYGEGPGFFSINLRLSKTFGLGKRETPAEEANQGPMGRGGMMVGRGPGGGGPGGGGGGPRGGGGGPRGGGGGGFRGGPGGFFGGSSDHRYSLTFSVSAQNLLNRTNAGAPVGNLTSPLFGQSTGIAGRFGFGGPGGGGGGDSAANRRIELQARFNF